MSSYIVCVFCSLHLVISSAQITNTEGHKLTSPAPDFSRHRIVQPVVLHGRTKREISTTRDKSGTHHSEVTMKVPVDDEEYILDLKLNEGLIPDSHVLRYQDGDKTVLHKPKKEELDLCHYSGTVRDRPGSWVAVSTCHGVQGIVADGKRVRYIEPAQGDITSQHYVFDHSDLTVPFKCGTKDKLTPHSHHEPIYHKHPSEEKQLKNTFSELKLASENSSAPLSTGKVPRMLAALPRCMAIMKPKTKPSKAVNYEAYNANNQTRYVELVLVVDHSQYKANGRNLRTVYHQMKTLTNIINSVYIPLNIFISLVGVEVWTKSDQIKLNGDALETLEEFRKYRILSLVKDMPNDNAHLLTGQKFQNGTLGIAFTGGMCKTRSSCGLATNHTKIIGLLAMSMAHEIGHNFGMDHDADGQCDCSDKQCIMYYASTKYIPHYWSSCSLDTLKSMLSRGIDYCLRNKPKQLFESPTCGNGFVEPGEQCDCGTMSIKGAYNPCHACCDPATCKLRANATCGAGSCCDLHTCRPKSAGTECRSADRECDLPEYCTGLSGNCPDDVYKIDTTPCKKGREIAYCVRGDCRTHTDQCRAVWGSLAFKSDDTCYETYNVNGDETGDCGYDVMTTTYETCELKDALCGRLQCTYYNIFQFDFRDYTCQSTKADMGLNDIDPTMVPDGASCGIGKMCLNQKCVSVAEERKKHVHGATCFLNCLERGYCNSAGHCHCNPGFAPPYCANPGHGGSYDSGPLPDPTTPKATTSPPRRFTTPRTKPTARTSSTAAPDTTPKPRSRLKITMYVVLLGVIPVILLVVFLKSCVCNRGSAFRHYVRPLLRFESNNYTHDSNSSVNGLNDNNINGSNVNGLTNNTNTQVPSSR